MNTTDDQLDLVGAPVPTGRPDEYRVTAVAADGTRYTTVVLSDGTPAEILAHAAQQPLAPTTMIKRAGMAARTYAQASAWQREG